MNIQLATLADVPDLAKTEALARPDGWSSKAIADSLLKPHVFSLIARLSGEAVAHVLGSEVAGEGEILTIAVKPSHRRRGVAKALLEACYQRWLAASVSGAFLEVRESNHGARALYGHTGWEEVGHRERYYRDGETAVLMRWSPS